MKTITIDFSQRTVNFPDGKIIGCEGVHNAVMLKAVLPERMICEEIKAYTMLFFNGNGDVVLSDELLLDGNSVSCTLWEQLLCGRGLSVQVQGIGFENDEVTMVDKTPIAELEIERSIRGEAVAADSDSHSMTAQLTAIREKLARIEILGSIDGVCLEKTEINSRGELLLTYTNGKIYNVGSVQGADGQDGQDGEDGKDGVPASHFWDGTTLTVTSASGTSSVDLKGEKGDKGDKGSTGARGTDGRTPVKGVDYYTDADKSEMKASNIAFISAELAKRGQLKPEFANGTDDCTDTTKLYVLPDGNIYAYMFSKVSGIITEQVNTTYTSGRLSVSDGSVKTTTVSNGIVTDFIDISNCTVPLTLNLSGIQWAEANDNQQYAIVTYNEDKTLVSRSYLKTPYTGEGIMISDETTNLTVILDEKFVTGECKYLRICGAGDSANAVITMSYDGTTEEYAWANTGHAFVPADYEERIVQTEADIEELKTKVNRLKGTKEVPDYVLEEAERVADNVLSVRNANSFVFGAVSDLHTSASDASAAGVLHAGMGMNAINGYTQLDMVALLGDIVYSKFDDTYKEGFKFVKTAFGDVAKAVPVIQLQGNHDELSTDTTAQGQQKYWAYIGANNVGTVTDYDNKFRNYGYRDFENNKIRVIYLNTTDVSEAEITSDCYVSYAQLLWLCNTALDFSGKPDAEKWGALILTHHPLNWAVKGNVADLLSVLDAYKGKANGTVTVDNTTFSFDFSNSKAELIAHIHGHLHNFRTETLGANGIVSITVPNACFGRNNEYGTAYSEATAEMYGDADESGNQRVFEKTSDTANDTAFNVLVVDRKNRVIHCFNYGAGIDRAVEY